MSGVTASRADRSGVVLTALSATLFGTLAVYGKLADRMDIPLTELLAIRFGLAAVVLWVLAAVRGERLEWGRPAAGLAGMGFLYVAQAGAYFGSLRTVPAAVTSILLYLYPAIVMVLAALFLGERLGRLRLAALAVAGSGVFAVVDPLSAHGQVDRAGVLLGVATAVIYAMYILAGRVLLREVPAVVATAVITTVASATLGVVGALRGDLRPLPASGYALAASMAVVATAVPATLLLAGLARIGATRAAIISTLEPATTVVLAALVVGESLGTVRLLGGALVLVGAVMVARNVPADLVEPHVHD